MRSTGIRLSLLALVVITIAGGAVRVDAAADPNAYQSVDERSYVKLGLGLAEDGRYHHRALQGPVHWPPGAPALFAAAHRMAPAAAERGRYDIPAAYAAQAVVATALIPAVFALGLLLAGPAAGLVAAAAVAGYPPLARSPGDLLSEPLGALLVVCGLIGVLLALRRPAWWRFLLAGLTLGALVLTRADLVLVPALAAAVVLVARGRGAGRRAGAVAAGALALGSLALAVPWSWYASKRAQTPTLISSGSASNLFIGTYLPGDGRLFGVKRELAAEVKRRRPGLRDVRAANLPQTAVMDTIRARRPELRREAALRAEALENLRRYALGEPLAFAAMMARKVGRLWGDYTAGSVRRRAAWITALHLALVGLAGAGLAAGAWRRRSAGLVLVAAIVLYVTALNAVMVSEARHNLAVMPALLAAGAAGWAAVLRRDVSHAGAPRGPATPSGSPATTAAPAPRR